MSSTNISTIQQYFEITDLMAHQHIKGPFGAIRWLKAELGVPEIKEEEARLFSYDKI